MLELFKKGGESVKTLYIDVYFLINFTVDILALHLSAQFTKTPTTPKRLFLASLVGALYAVFGVLLIDYSLLMIPITLFFFFIIINIGIKRVSLSRRLKFSLAFLVFEVLIAGLVYYAYCTLDKFTDLSSENIGAENRNLLILSLIILLAIGALKIIIFAFSNLRSERVVSITLKEGDRKITLDALVDSGNLACDPFDKTPVLFVNESVFLRLFSIKSFDINLVSDEKLKKKIRVVPILYGTESKIVYGIKPEGAYINYKRREEEVAIIVAFDKKGGKYGGYDALMPLSALADIL